MPAANIDSTIDSRSTAATTNTDSSAMKGQLIVRSSPPSQPITFGARRLILDRLCASRGPASVTNFAASRTIIIAK